MAKTRKPVSNSKKALLQKEINSKCPVCGNEDVNHFQVHHIDENPANDDFGNLLMLCPICHSKITKGDIPQSEVILLKRKMRKVFKEDKSKMGKVINFHSRVENAVVGDNNRITINVRKPAGKIYPEGSIGADNMKCIYVSYLLTRYHEYKENEVGKENMNYAIFPSNLKKKFKIGKTKTIYHIPINRFEELVQYMQSRIDGTRLAKINIAKRQMKNYQSFEEYIKIQS